MQIKENTMEPKIKVVAIDIDGVMTNGTKLYGLDGKCIGKSFCDRDFTAILRLKEKGVYVCFISGDKTINEEMARIRNIPFYYVDVHSSNKVNVMDRILEERGIMYEEACYVGDDLFDLELLQKVGLPACPSDAISDLRLVNDICMLMPGGMGVIAELYDRLVWRNRI